MIAPTLFTVLAPNTEGARKPQNLLPDPSVLFAGLMPTEPRTLPESPMTAIPAEIGVTVAPIQVRLSPEMWRVAQPDAPEIGTESSGLAETREPACNPEPSVVAVPAPPAMPFLVDTITVPVATAVLFADPIVHPLPGAGPTGYDAGRTTPVVAAPRPQIAEAPVPLPATETMARLSPGDTESLPRKAPVLSAPATISPDQRVTETVVASLPLASSSPPTPGAPNAKSPTSSDTPNTATAQTIPSPVALTGVGEQANQRIPESEAEQQKPLVQHAEPVADGKRPALPVLPATPSIMPADPQRGSKRQANSDGRDQVSRSSGPELIAQSVSPNTASSTSAAVPPPGPTPVPPPAAPPQRQTLVPPTAAKPQAEIGISSAVPSPEATVATPYTPVAHVHSDHNMAVTTAPGPKSLPNEPVRHANAGAADTVPPVAVSAPDQPQPLPGLSELAIDPVPGESHKTAVTSSDITRAVLPMADHAPRVIETIAQAARALVDRPVELALNPEELGRVRMTLQATDGGMSVLLTVERPETLELLRRNIDQLAADLRQAGYERLTFGFSGDQQTGGQPMPKQHAPGTPSAQPTAPATEPPQPLHLTLAGEGLDLRI